jgi:Uma2 family endonuclease
LARLGHGFPRMSYGWIRVILRHKSSSQLTQMAWVTTSPFVKTYTLEEFWELPELPDHSKLELIAGVLYMTLPPDYRHSKTVSDVIRLVVDYLIKTENKGSIYVPRAGIKGPNSWLEPDFFYVAADTNAYTDPTYPEYMTTADLVIEVISLTSAIYDRNTKADTYAALGVKELWLVDESARIIELRVLQGDRYAPSVVLTKDDYLKSVVLAGFEVRVGNVFGD